MKVLISLLVTGFFALSCTLNAQVNGQLVIFIQDGRSISQDFKRNALPAINQLAKHNDLKLKIVEASEGAPLEVAYTPAIFYKEGNKTVMFDGRYSDLDELATFVKSGGSIQPKSIEKTDSAILTWNIGRATMKTTMNVHPLSGKPPRAKKFNAQQFEKEAIAALMKGMEFFQKSPSGENGHSKTYRMEFYPEVNLKEGVILVQMELYSAFDQSSPVFKTVIPTGSEWKQRKVAFEKAGNRIEKALIAQISNWDNGDGFDTLKDTTPVQSWSAAMSYQNEENPLFIIEKGIGGVIVSERE